MAPGASPIDSEAFVIRFMTTCCTWLRSPMMRGRPSGRRQSKVTVFAIEARKNSALSRTRAVRSILSTTKLAAPRVREHLPGEVGGTVDGLDRLLEVGALRGLRRQGQQREVDVPEERHEEVVEVVRDAAGEHPEALQLLGVQQAALELEPLLVRALALGDVEPRAEDLDGRPGGIPDELQLVVHPAPAPVPVAEAVVVSVVSLREELGQAGEHALGVLRVDAGGPEAGVRRPSPQAGSRAGSRCSGR